MYELPKDLDFQDWIGRRLDLVSFGKYTIHFNFDGELRITVLSSFSHQKASASEAAVPINVEKDEWWNFLRDRDRPDLLLLLGHTVKNVSDEGDRTLRMEFDSGDTLKFYDPHEPYEAYHIEYAGKLIVV
jgi:hypothetical protein